MKTLLATFPLLILILCQTATGATSPVTLVDDAGYTLKLDSPAKRIVSLAPHVTELVYAAGAGSRLVGAVQYSTYPEAAKKLPLVGGYTRFDAETILSLKPDLVIGWVSGNPKEQVERLRQLGLKIFLTQPDQIDDVARNIDQIGILAGTSAIARTESARFRNRHKTMAIRYATQPPVRVFYQVWKNPLMTIGGQQIISNVLTLCGGKNIFAQFGTLAPIVTEEAVLAENPEVIIASGMDESRPEWLEDWRRWASMTAVSRNNLFHIPPELIQRHTPRLLDGAEKVCQYLEQARSNHGL
ncbi:cobalamin-binding protein [Denitratisoma sp. DHT3]|uniref:cobalamin-binding protein n=1 Tax=Denitratisoma sp. DHT3 TaxID=1981880 RepID=UPI0011987325|nr:cobalamin-binding protein [Denitratisoma sp. DHT3]QDX81600.1 cobalamin-binding protein [Denitratisoma sp. DHT3]